MNQLSIETEVSSSKVLEQITGSRILLVIDYPNKDNLEENKITCGASGTILSTCMASAGLILSSTSVIYVLPFSNEGKGLYRYWTEKGGFTTEGLPFLDALKAKILSLNPTLIVPIGELALQATTDKKGIEKYRGSILESSLCENLKTIPTLHPRDTFKRFLLRYHISSDFRRVNKESNYKDLRLPKRDLRINPSFLEAKAFLEDILSNKKTIASDIECAIPKPVKNPETGVTKIYGTKGITCISFATSPLECVSIPFNNYVWTEEQEVILWLLISKIMADTEIKKKWQNGACFDMVYLLIIHSIFCLGNVSDTLIKANILYPEFPKSLAFLTSTRTEEPYYKDDGKEVNVDGTKDWDKYYIYNAKDSAVDFEIDISLDEELEKNNKEMWLYSQKLIEPLLYMMCRGIKINEKKLFEHKEEAKKTLKSLQEKLNALTGSPLNVGSAKQCIEFFYEKRGFKKISKVVKDSKTGERKETISCDNKSMTKIARLYDSEEARLVKKIRGAKKLISTYLELPFDEDGRLRGSFKQSTKFGRLASTKTPFKTGMNQQNLPKVFMEFLEADEDHFCFELDKKQAEWVASAYYFNDANMIKAVEEEVDIHVRTAKLMFSAPESLIEKEDKILGSCTEPTEIEYKRNTHCPEVFNYPILPNMSMRQAGKKCNHSFNYGLGANGFANNYDMSLSTAKACYALYHKSYPGIKHGHERIRNKIIVDRTLVNGFGWKRRFLGRLDDDTFRQAYAFYGQSTVGRNLNEGIITTYNDQYDPERKSSMYDVDIFTQVHDSLKGQYPDSESRFRDFAKALKRMQENLDIPLKANGKEYIIKTDAKVGYNLKNLETIPLYGTVEEIVEKLKEIKKTLKPLKEKLSDIETSIEEALEQEEEDLINQKTEEQENKYEF